MNHSTNHDRCRPSRRLGGGRLLLATMLLLTLPATISDAEQDHRPRKPTRPSAAIDNEGPLVVIRQLETRSNHQDRRADPGRHWLPWRPVIRLDLILPLHDWPTRPVDHRP